MRLVTPLSMSLGFASGLLACMAEQPGVQESLVGAWTILEASRIETSSDITPVPVSAGLFLFTDARYSIVWTSADAGDVHSLTADLVDGTQAARSSWDIPDTERITRFNSTIVNSGVYEISGTTLTTVPSVALVPEFIGGRATHEYQLVGDTLVLTVVNLVARDGTQHPLYESGARFRYRLLRLR